MTLYFRHVAFPSVLRARLSIFDLPWKADERSGLRHQPAGSYEVTFDATGLPSGVYLYRLEAGDYVETKRLVVVR